MSYPLKLRLSRKATTWSQIQPGCLQSMACLPLSLPPPTTTAHRTQHHLETQDQGNLQLILESNRHYSIQIWMPMDSVHILLWKDDRLEYFCYHDNICFVAWKLASFRCIKSRILQCQLDGKWETDSCMVGRVYSFYILSPDSSRLYIFYQRKAGGCLAFNKIVCFNLCCCQISYRSRAGYYYHYYYYFEVEHVIWWYLLFLTADHCSQSFCDTVAV